MLDRVTITGADDNTEFGEMSELSSEFPFLEWGILVSKSREGTARYPSSSWRSYLQAVATDDDTMRLSMHVCGAWARAMFDGSGWEVLPGLKYDVNRIQVNGAGDAFPFKIGYGSQRSNPIQFIFQHPRSHDALLAARRTGFDAAALFDQSGGEGILPDTQPLPVPGVYCGYAGGLGPDNVVAEIEKIQRVCKSPFWIDMEGRVRTEDRLDMDKVRRVLELCAPFVAVGIDTEGM